MRELTISEIERLASRPNVKKIAVKNFLMSMGTNFDIACLNLRQDTELYKWNRETVKAIEDGIQLAK